MIQDKIAQRAAQELKPYSTVNLGIGLPTLVAKYVSTEKFIFHTENGLLGVTACDETQIDPQRVDAGKKPVGERIGASFFDSAESFAMIRGGHIDVAMLGILQVDEQGRIANWAIPGKNILGVGGAMDLLCGAKEVIALTTHTTKDGKPKIVEKCQFPITGVRPINTVITELGVFRFQQDHWVLTEIMPGSSLKEIREKTEAKFEIAASLIKQGGGPSTCNASLS